MEIEAYRFGEMRIDGTPYRKDLLIANGVVIPGWWREEGHRFSLVDLAGVLDASPRILVAGTGAYGMVRIPEEVVQELERRGIALHALRTGEAVKRFNALRDEPGVAGAFHLTC